MIVGAFAAVVIPGVRVGCGRHRRDTVRRPPIPADSSPKASTPHSASVTVKALCRFDSIWNPVRRVKIPASGSGLAARLSSLRQNTSP